MADNSWALKLLTLDENELDRILNVACDKYFKLIGDIAADIYDSCIKDYYTQYGPPEFPVVYGRHGDKKGKNLYLANDFYYDPSDDTISLFADPNDLMPYGGKGDKRKQILDLVMSGVRGSTKRRCTKTGLWPKQWATSYPNKYSDHKEWTSSKGTIEEIYDDFIENVQKKTQHLFYEYIKNEL